jgi:hypothetical protein
LFTEEGDLEARAWADSDALDQPTHIYHVVVDRPSGLALPAGCTACGCRDEVFVRRVNTMAPQPGIHFFTWAGRPLRLPLCRRCDSRLRRRLEVPLVVWFFALPAAVGLLAWACGGGLLPFPGVALSALIAIPVWLVRRWQNRQPQSFEITDYRNQIDFAWADSRLAAQFAELNDSHVVPTCVAESEWIRE